MPPRAPYHHANATMAMTTIAAPVTMRMRRFMNPKSRCAHSLTTHYPPKSSTQAVVAIAAPRAGVRPGTPGRVGVCSSLAGPRWRFLRTHRCRIRIGITASRPTTAAAVIAPCYALLHRFHADGLQTLRPRTRVRRVSQCHVILRFHWLVRATGSAPPLGTTLPTLSSAGQSVGPHTRDRSL